MSTSTVCVLVAGALIALLASTAAAKANAYVGGHVDAAWVERELPLVGQVG